MTDPTTATIDANEAVASVACSPRAAPVGVAAIAHAFANPAVTIARTFHPRSTR